MLLSVSKQRLLQKKDGNRLDYGLGGGSVLGLYPPEFFFELIGSHIVEAAQFVDLPQCELGLSQISQLRLGVVLTHVLICSRHALVEFVQYHTGI